jgi:hypothetical protein
MTETEFWEIIQDWIAIVISIIAIFIACYFSWGKYKLNEKSVRLQEYSTWFKEINPTPNILITKGKVEFRDSANILRDEFKVSAFIANSGEGNANHPKWTWRLNLEDKKWAYGDIHKDIIIRDKTDQHQMDSGYCPYLKANSTSYPIYLTGSYDFKLKNINEREKINSLEIWVKYFGKKNTEWYSYRLFKFEKKQWIAEKPTKVWMVKKRQNIKK